MKVHRIGNCSDTDDTGRLLRFRVGTCCGLTLAKPILLTDKPKQVTCGRCIIVMAVWGGADDRRKKKR